MAAGVDFFITNDAQLQKLHCLGQPILRWLPMEIVRIATAIAVLATAIAVLAAAVALPARCARLRALRYRSAS